ncbi:hypothetical protein OSSY52_07920 [Tepiditoga spiralis]|uniref:Prepilin-type N-terminal cleavage/methylation domain-containing protein n=1 Tax=Tepiditoga spiralis TaxID=2108365 RepID=A0A7G1G2R6_9BACT|nr:type II secretion system protein [Tepiditoga spiralis]BBE30651.1 hypothetical protein OSSY52_07920 [Tepiditoga spiralis]
MKNSKEGFTIVEVLLVLAVMALIASISIPAVNTVLSQAKATKIISDMRNIQSAVIQYSMYSSDASSLSMENLVKEEYLTNEIPNIQIKDETLQVEIYYNSNKPDIKYFKKIDPNIEEYDGKPSIRVLKK